MDLNANILPAPGWAKGPKRWWRANFDVKGKHRPRGKRFNGIYDAVSFIPDWKEQPWRVIGTFPKALYATKADVPMYRFEVDLNLHR